MKTLTRGLEKKNHHVFFDNFFTSVNLLEDLEKDGIYGCGTVRRQRKGLPSELKNPGLKKSSDVYLCVCVCVWDWGGGGGLAYMCMETHAYTYMCTHLQM